MKDPERKGEHMNGPLDVFVLSEEDQAAGVRLHTAWLCTDAEVLSGAYSDVGVVANDERGATLGGDPVFYDETDVRHGEAANDRAAQESAKEVLRAAGWTLTEEWQAVPHGYAAYVEQS